MLNLTHENILAWLREKDPARRAELYAAADAVRAQHVGSPVHLRALLEISNLCVRQCGYCGLRAGNTSVSRYRMFAEEILAAAEQAAALGYGTVVLQAGEDPQITRDWMAALVRRIKQRTPLAVTLSLGERSHDDLAAWRAAGADRYLLRLETSDRDLFAHIHPPARAGEPCDRVEILRTLRTLGYEVGSGIMVGIPGQTLRSVADDLLLFRELDLDMIGIGPYIAHGDTPLGRGENVRPLPPGEEQAPATEAIVYTLLALTRLLCPQANIPATTALATLNPKSGREQGLQRGANVLMPNFTPPRYRERYQIYPNKACLTESATTCHGCMRGRIQRIGRSVGAGPGGRRRELLIG